MTLKFRFYHVDGKIKSPGKKSLISKATELNIIVELILMCNQHMFPSAQAKERQIIECFYTDCEFLLKEHKEVEIEIFEKPQIYKPLHDNFPITLIPSERIGGV